MTKVIVKVVGIGDNFDDDDGNNDDSDDADDGDNDDGDDDDGDNDESDEGGLEQPTPWTRELPLSLHFSIYSGSFNFSSPIINFRNHN